MTFHMSNLLSGASSFGSVVNKTDCTIALSTEASYVNVIGAVLVRTAKNTISRRFSLEHEILWEEIP